YFFVTPQGSFAIYSLQDGLILGLYFIIALVTGNLTARLSSQKKIMHQREDRTAALYLMAHQIAEAKTFDEVLETAVQQVGTVFDAEIAILLPTPGGHLALAVHRASTLQVDEKEYSVAQWAFDHKQNAGRFTDTLSNSLAQYLPMITP